VEREVHQQAIYECGSTAQLDPADAGVAALLEHVRFRLDARWPSTTARFATSPDIRRQVVEGCLSAVARDVPFLFALFLLLNARDATCSRAIARAGINRKRTRQGRARLLDHLEVRASLDALGSAASAEPGGQRTSRSQACTTYAVIWCAGPTKCSGAHHT